MLRRGQKRLEKPVEHRLGVWLGVFPTPGLRYASGVILGAPLNTPGCHAVSPRTSTRMCGCMPVVLPHFPINFSTRK
jgi:hypothetical protein